MTIMGILAGHKPWRWAMALAAACAPLTAAAQVQRPVDNALFGADRTALTVIVAARGQQTVPPEVLHTAAARALTDWLASGTSSHHVAPAAMAAPVEVPAGPLTARARSMPAGLQAMGTLVVWVEVLVSGHVVRVVPVPMRVSAVALRWVATGPIDAGTKLSPGLFERRPVDISSCCTDPFPELPEGARVARAQRAGQVLDSPTLLATHDIQRGQAVQATWRQRDVRVQALASALQDGRIGQDIHVRISGSHDSVVARVLGPGQVRMNGSDRL